MKDVDHRSPYCIYYGSSLEELKAVFHTKLPKHPSAYFEFYTKRFGMSRRELCPEVLPADLDEIFVRIRVTAPMNCSVCGPNGSRAHNENM